MNETVDVLVGKTLASVERNNEGGDDVIRFVTTEGDTYKMYHYQDCCESVGIEEIHGNLEDLVGSPIVVAEETVASGYNDDDYESWTATFYHFRTHKGTVTVRWMGSSNGYYSEAVDFEKVEK